MTFCDFKIRNLGDNIHQHSVQCALPINLLNEKFFIVLWFWLLFLTCVTIFNFITWIKTMFPQYRRTSIGKYLRSQVKLGDSEKEVAAFNKFVLEYCHLDGAFIFQILRRNSNFIAASDIISSLWFRFCEHLNEPNYVIRASRFGKDSIELGMNDKDDEKRPLGLRFHTPNSSV